MRKVLAILTALLFFGGLANATTTTTTLVQDVTSSKNEVLAKGTSPHVRLFDTDAEGTTVSFEAFEVHLHPTPSSSLCCGAEPVKLDKVMCAIQAQWPEFHPDEVEIARLYEPT